MRIIELRDTTYIALIDSWLREEQDVSYGLKEVKFLDHSGELNTFVYNYNSAFELIEPDKYVSLGGNFVVREI
jgi:hypothetical protein